VELLVLLVELVVVLVVYHSGVAVVLVGKVVMVELLDEHMALVVVVEIAQQVAQIAAVAVGMVLL
jgi:hypothetical protein